MASYNIRLKSGSVPCKNMVIRFTYTDGTVMEEPVGDLYNFIRRVKRYADSDGKRCPAVKHLDAFVSGRLYKSWENPNARYPKNA